MKKPRKSAADLSDAVPALRRKHVLVAILGTSPAVLTEAIWALAMEKNIVPDEIVVLTTSIGRDDFLNKVKGKIWNQLLSDLKANGKPVGKLKIGEKNFKIFPDENQNFAKDLPSYEANMRAADTMIEVLDDVIGGDECVVHGLIAGGRKTMTALFFACMGLMARKGDQVYHVLVTPECERDPDFYYPRDSSDAKVNLFSVPFVRVGGWTEEMRKKCRSEGKGLTYRNLIDAVEKGLDTALSSRKRRAGAGGRSSLPDGMVTSFWGIADNGRTIRAGKESYKITNKWAWKILDKLLRAAKANKGDGWISCSGNDLNRFRSPQSAWRFREEWIDTRNAPRSKKIDRARLVTSIIRK